MGKWTTRKLTAQEQLNVKSHAVRMKHARILWALSLINSAALIYLAWKGILV